MASMAIMTPLKKFPKPGVRVPGSLRKRIGQYLLDHQDDVVYLNHKGITMEGLFVVAVLDFLDLDNTKQLEIFTRRIPEIRAMFEAETPKPSNDATLAERGEGHEVIESEPQAKRPRRREAR